MKGMAGQFGELEGGELDGELVVTVLAEGVCGMAGASGKLSGPGTR